MNIAIITCDGFNELDSFIASAILNRVKLPDWKAWIVTPSETVTSMNGVKIMGQKSLAYAQEADVVLFGSGIHTRSIVEDKTIMSEIRLDPDRQFIGAQCSGALFLHKLGLIDQLPVCTDSMTRPFMEEFGITVLDQPFIAHGNIASAGGCLSSQYLAMWAIWHTAGLEAAKKVIHYVAPVGQKDSYLSTALKVVGRYFD